MEITLVRSEALSEPISIHAMENEPVETSAGPGGGPALEAVDFQENNIHCSSDGISVQRAGCSSSTIPANDDSTGQESLTSECRNTEHIEICNITKSSMLPGRATSLVRGVQADNDDILDTDGVQLESRNLASSQSLAALVGTQAVLSCMPPQQSTDLSAQQTVAPSQCPPVEAEQAGLSGTQAVQVLQPEMQPSILLFDAPPEKTHRDDRGQAGCQPDRATGLSKGGAATSHHLGDVRMQVQERDIGNVAADSPVTLQVCTAKQSSALSQHPPAEAKQTDKPAGDLQPEVQPSTSDEPAEAEDEAEDEPEVPEVEDETEADDEPAEAERAGTLGAIAAQNLQPEMQSLTTHVEHSLDPHGRVESAGMVTAHDLQAEILPSASVPTEQSTSPAQQSLATSGHSPAEAEQADILGTETTCSLQPSQGEVQLSTTMQDQPAEVQACTLGAIAARSLQPETQPSTSTQSAPFERTYLVGMPVLRSHSARAESRTLGSLIARDLHSEVHPLASMQDRPAEAEGAVMLGSTAAQDLQPELQSSTTVQHVPLERIHSEERRQIGFQPNMVPGPEQPTLHPPVTALVFNNPILSDEPLKNELERLMRCSNVLRKDHEHKYYQEIEKITKKYDLLLQKEDSAYLQNQCELTDLYRKVFVNKSLAENFRRVFTPSSAAQGRLMTPVVEQPFESSSAAQTRASPAISSSAIRSPGSYVRPSFVALPPSSSSWNAQLPGNLYGTASSPFVPAPVPYGSYGPAGAQSRAVQPLSALASNLYRTMPPAPPPHVSHGSYGSAAAQLRASSPHLQQLRMSSQYAMHTDQQQRRAASAAVPLLGQYVRGSYASTVPQGGAIRNSMDPSSAHQASSSRRPRRASLLPPRRHPESMLSLQPSTSNPIFMRADQSSSYPSMALGGTAGPQNAAPGSQQHGGAQIAGINHNQPGSEPALQEWTHTPTASCPRRSHAWPSA